MGPVALDASIAVAFLDPLDVHHERAVSALRECDGSALSMSASAYSETLVRPLADGHGAGVDEFVDGLGIEIVPVDRGIARRAAELRAEHADLRLPDATIAAAAELLGARLLTFDQRLAQLLP